MQKKKFLTIIYLLLTLSCFPGNRLNLDSLFFNTSYFQMKLDSLYPGHFRQAPKIHESENREMISGAEPVIRSLTESEIEKQVNGMSSVIHVSYTPKVKEFIDVLLLKKPEASCLLLTLAGHYVPLFQAIFDPYGIPHELAYLPAVISVFDPGSTSIYGSAGIWNFMYISGKLYNLEINSMVDERKNYQKSTDAAARDFKDLFGIYQDWTLALTAFISGPAVVNKAIRRAGGKKDFWSLYPFLPSETRDYLPAYTAMMYLVNYHDLLKLQPLQADLPFTSDTVSVTKELHFRQISKVLDIPITTLRILNPQFKHDILPAGPKTCILCLPESFGEKFRLLHDSIYNYKDSVLEASRQTNVVFPASSTNHWESETPSGRYSVYYTVKSGDNLGAIAAKYHVTVAELKSWNHMKSTLLSIGQKIVIYSTRNTISHPPDKKK